VGPGLYLNGGREGPVVMRNLQMFETGVDIGYHQEYWLDFD
jgi:hypothetical protein